MGILYAVGFDVYYFLNGECLFYYLSEEVQGKAFFATKM